MHGDLASPQRKGTRARMRVQPHEFSGLDHPFRTQKRKIQPSSSVFETGRKASAHPFNMIACAIALRIHDFIMGSSVVDSIERETIQGE